MARTLEGKHPKYYEAILQLRDISEDVLSFVESELRRIKLIVAKKIKVKNGLDYFLADNEMTRALGKRLQQRFGGLIKVTASLHTKKDDKEKYRVTVLFRLPCFKRGDLVEFEGEDYLVKAMGKDIFLQNPKNGKKIHLKYREMGKVKKR